MAEPFTNLTSLAISDLTSSVLGKFAKIAHQGEAIKSRQLDLAWTAFERPSLAPDSNSALKVVTTISPNSGASIGSTETTRPERIYPHAYDPQGIAGEALRFLALAKHEASDAIREYSDGNLDGVANRLNFIAVLASKAYAHTAFNSSLGAALSFIRRATLAASAAESSHVSLMALSKALETLFAAPLIGLDAAAELVDNLERHGWQGENQAVASFVAALFDTKRERSPTEIDGGIIKSLVGDLD